MTSLDSKKRLIEGNARFMTGNTAVKELGHEKWKHLADNGQKPFALIVCCSDSRVPPELVFDQGLGDLFVVRTAGNVVDEICLGSIEYGVLHLHIPLVLVLGHENCGAVKATVDGGEDSGSIKSVIDKISVSLSHAHNHKDVYTACEDENILHTVDEIKNNEAIRKLIRLGKVEVRGAKYGIRSGKVTFF